MLHHSKGQIFWPFFLQIMNNNCNETAIGDIYRQKEENALENLDTIYREYADTVFRFLMAKTGSPELAEELTQETFFQAVRSIHRFGNSFLFLRGDIGIGVDYLFNLLAVCFVTTYVNENIDVYIFLNSKVVDIVCGNNNIFLFCIGIGVTLKLYCASINPLAVLNLACYGCVNRC